jgi:hypothetical protein
MKNNTTKCQISSKVLEKRAQSDKELPVKVCNHSTWEVEAGSQLETKLER